MSKKAVLTYKIPMYPLGSKEEKRTFYKTGNQLIYNAIKIMNEAITMHYIFVKERMNYKNETGQNLDVYRKYGVKTYTTVINRTIKEKFKSMELPGDLYEQIVRKAIDTFNTNSKEILKSNASLPSFTKTQPLPVRAKSLSLAEDYTIYLPMMSESLAKDYGFKGKRKQSFQMQLKLHKNAKVIIDRRLNGTYKMLDSKFMRDHKGDWLLLLSYEQPVKKIQHDKNKIMGIDLGIINAVTMAITDTRKVHVIKGGEITKFRNNIEGRRKSILNQLPVASKNRRGHGIKTLLKPNDKLSKKVENFKSTTNHRYSKYIIDIALKYGVGTIQMEDLTNISRSDSFLKTWSFYDLQSKIKYKANMNGIDVKLIDPSYTSQRCFHCGNINQENRKKQAIFHCIVCGHKRNADYNAAENITISNIEDVIKKQLKVMKK